MKDGTGTAAGEPAELSRRELYEAYVSCHVELCAEAGPCRDGRLLSATARYLRRDPEPADAFSAFPFRQAVAEGLAAPGADCRRHLCAFVKAAELLETLCVNLFLQPWKKEIRTLKTYTGPFVYCLLPVLSSSTIKTVLASIGYLPHKDPPSEFRLSEDANPDRAKQVGFELLLARVKCYHLLELLEKDQLGPQEWLEVLQKPTKPEEPTEKETTIELKEEEKTKKKEADRKEVPQYLETKLAVQPQPKPKPRRCHMDPSIVEMQRTYPDLAFRGRPLVTDKPCSSKDARTASGDGKVTELPRRDAVKGTKAAASSESGGGSKAEEVFGDGGRNSRCTDRNGGGAGLPGQTSSSSTGESGVDEDLSGPQGISLHITLRSGSKAEKSPNPGDPWPPAEPPAEAPTNRAARPELSSLSSLDEEQQLMELSQRMGQLCVKETKEEGQRKEDNKRPEERKERRRKGRKASAEGEAEEQNLRKPVMETGPALSHGVSRHTRSSQSAAVKEQKQPGVCQPSPSPLTVAAADCGSRDAGGGGGTGQQEGEDTEQLAQSFVIVDHHKK